MRDAPTPSLSVVIPAHNAAATLEAQLDAVAVASNGAPDVEIVVVDNRSTDNTGAVATSWGTATGRKVQVVAANDRASESYARNVGADRATGEFVCYCDSDDVVSPSWLDSMVAGFAHADYVTGPLDLDLLNEPWLAGVRGRSSLEKPARLWDRVPYAHGCNMGFRRSTLLDIGGFDESRPMGVDLEIGIRLWEAGHELRFEPGAVVAYRLRDSLRASFRQGVTYGRYRIAIRRRLAGSIEITSPAFTHFRRAWWLARHLPTAPFSRARRAKWTWVLSQLVGEMRGEVEFR